MKYAETEKLKAEIERLLNLNAQLVKGWLIDAVEKSGVTEREIVERPQGKWEKLVFPRARAAKDTTNARVCSNCGAFGHGSWHYCLNCGAKMENADDE